MRTPKYGNQMNTVCACKRTRARAERGAKITMLVFSNQFSNCVEP